MAAFNRLLAKFLLLLFFPLVALGFELRASSLLGRPSITRTTPPANFTLVILEMGVSRILCPGLALNCDSPGLSLPGSEDYRRELALTMVLVGRCVCVCTCEQMDTQTSWFLRSY
jgi:hypothetical protein